MQEIPVTSLDPRLQKQIENAQVALQRGNYDYVIEVCGTVLKNARGCVPVRRLQRAALYKKFESKNKFFTKALGSVTTAGFMFAGKKDPEKGIDNAEKMLLADPSNVAALKLLAESATQLELYETAAFAWEGIRDAQPKDHDTLLRLGEAFLTAKMPKEALKVADDLLHIKPQDGDALALMRKASVAQTMHKGNWESQSSFRDKLRDESQAVSLEQAAKIVTSSEMTERLVKEALQRVSDEPENINHYRSVIDGYRKLERYEEALSWVQKARQQPAGSGDSNFEKLETDLQVNLREVRLREAEKALADNPEDAEAQAKAETAKSELSAYRLEQAKIYVDRYPNDYAARHNLADLFYEAGDYQNAIANYQQAQKNPKVRIQAMVGMGKSLKQRGMHDLAVAQLQQAKNDLQAMDELKKDVIYTLAECFEAMGKTDAAIAEFKVIYSDDIGFRDVADKINAFYASS